MLNYLSLTLIRLVAVSTDGNDEEISASNY